jgi:hypothetical protein
MRSSEVNRWIWTQASWLGLLAASGGCSVAMGFGEYHGASTDIGMANEGGVIEPALDGGPDMDAGHGVHCSALERPASDGGCRGLQWSAAEKFATGPGAFFIDGLVMDAEGNAVAVWHSDKLTAARYAKGIGWDRALIDSPGIGDVSKVAGLPDREVLVTFPITTYSDAGVNSTAYSTRLGTIWSKPEPILGPDAQYSVSSSLVSDSDGHVLHAAIEGRPASHGEGTTNLIISSYDVEHGWGPGENLEQAEYASLAIDDNGGAMVLYSDTYGQILWRAYGNGSWGAWQHQKQANRIGTVVFNMRGQAAQLWIPPLTNEVVATGTTSLTLGAQTYDAKSGWSDVASLATVDDFTSLQTAMDELGNIVVVWARAYDSEIAGRRYDAATQSWGPTTRLSPTFSRATSSLPSVAARGGHALVAWGEKNDNKDPILWTRRYVADRGWLEPEQIQTKSKDKVYGLATALDDDGEALVVCNHLRDADGDAGLATELYQMQLR